jgi:hypothetical protein
LKARSVWWPKATKAGIDKLSPHDLRSYAAGGELEQIQFLLGHVSIQTTERYLGCKQRIQDAVNDRIGITELPWNNGRNKAPVSMEVARFLGWLTRERRIRLGKRIILACEAAKDGELHYVPHVQPSRGTVCVYLATSQSRADRFKTLDFLVAYAHMKYGAKFGVRQCLGVATEPIGNGRSYDFVVTRASPPPALLEKLRSIDYLMTILPTPSLSS